MSYDVFDPETALDAMVQVTALNDADSRLTMYVTICPEHGGFVASSMPKAIEAAKASNARAEVDGCRYFAVAIGLDPRTVASIFAEPPEAS